LKEAPVKLFRTLVPVAFAVAALGAPAFARKAAEGKPNWKPGDPESFLVWHDAAGWHLRATTPPKKQHAFHGVVRGQGIAEVKATRPALSSKLTVEAAVIRFDFDLFEGSDGFDWKQNEPCVTLELKIDGKPRVERIFVGAKTESPSAMPFDACQ
jgi:hypothetical protein